MIRFPLSPDEAAAAAYVVKIVEALAAASGNVRATAEALGMTERTLQSRLKDLGLVEWNRRVHPLDGRQPKCVACAGAGVVTTRRKCGACGQRVTQMCERCGGDGRGRRASAEA